MASWFWSLPPCCFRDARKNRCVHVRGPPPLRFGLTLLIRCRPARRTWSRLTPRNFPSIFRLCRRPSASRGNPPVRGSRSSQLRKQPNPRNRLLRCWNRSSRHRRSLRRSSSSTKARPSRRKNLNSAKGRSLNPTQADLNSKVAAFLQESKQAVREGDWTRARNLAKKAQVLSEELAASL